MSVNKRLNRLLQDLEKSSSVSHSSSTMRDGMFVKVDDVDEESIVTSSNIVLKRKLVENMSNILFAATERKKRKYLDISSTIDNDNTNSCHKPIQRINDEGGNATVTDSTNVSTSWNDMTVLPSTSSNTSIVNCINQNIVESIRELRNVYLHGLQTVSKLQDLRDAPDAILPGNFCI